MTPGYAGLSLSRNWYGPTLASGRRGRPTALCRRCSPTDLRYISRFSSAPRLGRRTATLRPRWPSATPAIQSARGSGSSPSPSDPHRRRFSMPATATRRPRRPRGAKPVDAAGGRPAVLDHDDRPEGRPSHDPAARRSARHATTSTPVPDGARRRTSTPTPRCIVGTGCNTLRRGTRPGGRGRGASAIDRRGPLRAPRRAWVARYGEDWRFEVHDGTFHAGPGSALVYRVAPVTAFGFGKGRSARPRWRFAAASISRRTGADSLGEPGIRQGLVSRRGTYEIGDECRPDRAGPVRAGCGSSGSATRRAACRAVGQRLGRGAGVGGRGHAPPVARPARHDVHVEVLAHAPPTGSTEVTPTLRPPHRTPP